MDVYLFFSWQKYALTRPDKSLQELANKKAPKNRGLSSEAPAARLDTFITRHHK
jgi:hypothetical protein